MSIFAKTDKTRVTGCLFSCLKRNYFFRAPVYFRSNCILMFWCKVLGFVLFYLGLIYFTFYLFLSSICNRLSSERFVHIQYCAKPLDKCGISGMI